MSQVQQSVNRGWCTPLLHPRTPMTPAHRVSDGLLSGPHGRHQPFCPLRVISGIQHGGVGGRHRGAGGRQLGGHYLRCLWSPVLRLSGVGRCGACFYSDVLVDVAALSCMRMLPHTHAHTSTLHACQPTLHCTSIRPGCWHGLCSHTAPSQYPSPLPISRTCGICSSAGHSGGSATPQNPT